MVKAAMLMAVALVAAAPAAARAQDAAEPDGIPVRSELVRARCGTCHRPDAQQRMTRISFRRATPENWERTIKRMIQLNHAPVEPVEARAIVKYLADNHGLAPEELRPVAFEVEHRLTDYVYQGDRETAVVCASCHSVGRPLTERRTKEEWEGVLAMHRGYYPGVDNQPMNDGQGFRRTRAVTEGADGQAGDKRQPMDRIIAHLAKAYPLNTSAWAEWSAARQPPMLAGRWSLSGYVPGKGPIYGTLTVTADPKEADTFVTETKFAYARSGEMVTRKGRSVVYTGYQWRGRSAAGATADAEPTREVLFVERAQKEMWGRWFTGAYDETGTDVRFVRVGSEPLAVGTSVQGLKRGTSVPALRIYGANFPARLTAAQVSLGAGITVSRVVSVTPDLLTVAVDVAADATPGPRDVLVAGAHHPAAFVVYDKVDSVRVLPQAGFARVGGAVFPKQFQQFEAVAFHNGPDKAANTADDWNLGPVDATWQLEEYAATFDDDDVKFVGAIDAAGLFTPNLDGPNPQRTFGGPQMGRNNIGDVWVVAHVSADAARGIAAPVRSRAHLVVSPPVYVNWLSSDMGK